MSVNRYGAQALADDLERLGLKPSDLCALTGVDRSTVWRWTTGRTEVPPYAQTIIQQATTIRNLSIKLRQ